MLFEKNMAAVAQFHPVLAQTLAGAGPLGEIQPSRSGAPTLKEKTKDGHLVYLHSAYEPLMEAARLTREFSLINGDILFVLGIGLGYHLWELMDRYPGVEMMAIDPHPGFFLKAMEVLDLTPYLERSNLELVFSTDVLEISRKVFNKIDFSSKMNVKSYTYAPVARLYPEEFSSMEQGLMEGLTQSLLNHNTCMYFAAQWTDNLLANLQATHEAQAVSSLYNQFTGVPGIIISAGPSLDKNMHLLKEIKGNAVTIAAGTALKPLLKAGIRPDLVASIDGGEPNAKNFQDVQEDEVALVFDPVVHYRIPPRFTGPRFVGSYNPSMHYWFDHVLGENKGALRSNGFSVSNICFGLALDMGCNPIIFIGQDLAFAGERSHVRGSIYDDLNWKSASGRLFPVEGNNGEVLQTSRAFLSFLRAFEDEIESLGGDKLVINATEGGARIKGTTVMTLREVIGHYITEDHRVAEKIEQIYRRHDPADGCDHLVKTLNRLAGDLAFLGKKGQKGEILANKLFHLYEKGLPQKAVLDRVKKGMDDVDKGILKKQGANLLLQRIFYPVHVKTFADRPHRHPEMEEKELGRLVARESQVFYGGLKETALQTEKKLREAIASIEAKC